MTPDRAAIGRRVLAWRPLAEVHGPRHGLDPFLVLGLVAQESQGKPGALRPEPGFWARYGANVVKAALASVSQHDHRWVQYPEIASASFGLCQVMYPVALEIGMDLEYPTDLCDPPVGIEAGCLVLARCVRQARAAAVPPTTAAPITRAALLRYNGGADLTYPQKVLDWRADLLELATPPPAAA